MNTRPQKSWNCKVDLCDGRCPDGCCGAVMATVTSPVTGRTVKLDYLAIPKDARYRIVEAVLKGHPDLKDRPYGPCVRLHGTCTVALTKSDLQTILKLEGAYYG